ncbi:excalibur calcium-binding domain-containing protein [Shewanella benthica]|uniref:excalibur calcium-binding domain-containing protein n=1 Tax=Shewanella benthica TaxID=43661 RepID=UPI00187A801F|nr:excalibur calcium-binding domain-containing protein [Shewanella benthica]MBE7214184.1 excalibur calcium-binding domain-containing protein [Shewanella benthica]MCL1061427.1 excalibur calcium-binding domain-containing protein [Shewanella benthica]
MERGTLVRWNDEKGFGFIEPDAANGKDVFIHISALKQMARKPVVGDQMMYHTELQSDGRIKAVKANIEGVAVIASTSSRKAHNPNDQRRNNHHQRQSKSSSRLLVPLLILLGLGMFGFNKYEEMTATPVLTNKDVEQMKFNPPARKTNPLVSQAQFRCEAGKTHCSQMRSCAEAKYYNRNCPGTKMDGDSDGIPCERQHCGH